MIDGITVLNNVTISNFNHIPWLCVLIGLLLVALIIICTKPEGFDKKNLLGVWWCGMFAISILLFIADIRFSKVDAIQCTIDDDVSINEVYDNYDIVDKQGEIWTLKEKTSEEA